MIRRIREWGRQPATTGTVIAANTFIVLALIWVAVIWGLA